MLVFDLIRLIRSVVRWKPCIKREEQIQLKEGYRIEMVENGPENAIIYREGNRHLTVVAEFALSNDVVLYVDSLKKWSNPKNEELTGLDYSKVINRVTRYLSCWGRVTENETPLKTIDDVKKDLRKRGIEFVENENGLVQFKIDAREFEDFKRIK